MKLEQLSPQAQDGLRQFAKAVHGDELMLDAINSLPESWASLVCQLHVAADRPEWFPKGKWATHPGDRRTTISRSAHGRPQSGEIEEFEVPGWTQEDVDRRNREVFGVPRLAKPVLPPDEASKDVPESLIEAECCRLLAEDGWRTLKTDPVSARNRGKGFGEPGMADTLALRYGKQPAACEVLWLEWKAPGGRVRKHQVAWHTRERARGALTVVAGVDFPASVKGFLSWYRASGLAKVCGRHGEEQEQ